MLGIELKQLVASFIEELRLIRSAVKELTGAVSDQKETADKTHDTQPQFHLLAELRTPEDVERNRSARDDRQYRLQQAIALGTWGAFIAAAVYAGIAACELKSITKSTKAAEEAAYASCLEAKTANNTLLEYQNSGMDSRLASIAAYAQAVTTMESEKTFVDATFTVPGNRPYNQPLSLLVRLKNTGKSDASNVHFTGWVIVAKPNSGGTSIKPKKQFSMQKDSLRVEEQFLPEVSGTTKEGNPHGFYVPVMNETGEPFIDTAELDRAVFDENKMAVFAFYTISYEDFTARYSRNACQAQYFWGANAHPLGRDAFDKQCNAYNTRTEVQKISMPAPSRPVQPKDFPEITCPAPPK